MEVYCKRCNKYMYSENGLCSVCTPIPGKSQGFLGKFGQLYDTFRKLAFKRNEDINDSIFDEKLNENEINDGVFGSVSKFSKNVAEDETKESDHTESTNFLESNGQNDQTKPIEWSSSTLNRDMSIVKRVTWADQAEQSSNRTNNNGPYEWEFDKVEQESKSIERLYKSLDLDKNDYEKDFIKSFSYLGLSNRKGELEKIDYEIDRYKQIENKLKEKLPENDHKPNKYDYLPKIGDEDEDLWQIKPRDDEEEYLKRLFFRESDLKKYTRHELDKSMSRAISCKGKLVEKYGIEINRININCLFDSNWVNDEIINFYMQILQEQSDRMRAKERLPSCYFFSTYFFTKMSGNYKTGMTYDYNAVAKWTKRKKVNIFEKDLLIVPVHVKKVHWALGVVDMRRTSRRIMMFDSLGGKNPMWFKNMKKWLADESKDKLKKVLNEINEWKIPMNYTTEPYAPSQKNTYDCGVFVCQYAKSITFGTGFGFAKESSAYLRNALIHEIISCKVDV
ncbi:ulp1 peptidase [Theileria orientalis]|uniref:Ulp1 peptidase n=1 Tax=Theileria orientalis TaxID=68886 RepID=A0A976MD64_THEOR|nr:ulp1 peptidase [Theileria orientalis]